MLAWLAALTPIAFSIAGLLLPCRGRVRAAARRPPPQRRESHPASRCPGVAAQRLPEPSGSPPASFLDDPLPGAAVRGAAVGRPSRGLIESESLSAVLAHEFGHLNSSDGRLTEALSRLALWDDPLAPARAGGEGQRRGGGLRRPGGGLLWGLTRWTLRLAGSFAHGFSRPSGRPTGVPARRRRRIRRLPGPGQGSRPPPYHFAHRAVTAWGGRTSVVWLLLLPSKKAPSKRMDELLADNRLRPASAHPSPGPGWRGSGCRRSWHYPSSVYRRKAEFLKDGESTLHTDRAPS